MQNIYFYLTPLSILLVLVELSICYFKRKNFFSFQDSIASLSTAILNQLSNLVVAFLVFKFYGILWEKRLYSFDVNILNFILLLLIIDFLFYWFHRFGHSINILWAAHMPHHTSEEFNLLVGLRASVTQRLLSFTFFWPLVLIGFKPETIYLATGIHLFLGYWHHTRLIGKLGLFEILFNTPSHHRVHHGINKKYLDKNFGEILIIWDRIFGTFAEEDPNEEVVFGVFNHPKSWNVLDINFAFYKVLWFDFKNTKFYFDKIRIWFMPLGWRPRDFEPRPSLPDVKKENFKKFESPMSGVPWYIILKIIISIGLMGFIIDSHFDHGFFLKIMISFTIFISLLAITNYLTAKKNAVIFDLFSWLCIVFLSFLILKN